MDTWHSEIMFLNARHKTAFSLSISSTLYRYISVRIFVCLLLSLFIILSALSLERLLRIIDLITQENALLSQAGALLLYLQPHYIGLALPAAFFISVIIAVRQMHESSELIVMQAAGVPYSRLLVPILAMATIATIFMIFTTSYLQPHGRYLYRSTVIDMKSQGGALRLQPGVFYDFNKNTTLRADSIGQRGRLLQGFFAKTTNQAGTTQVITAQQARINPSQAGDSVKNASLELTLKNVRIVETHNNASSTIITTDTYPLVLDLGLNKTYGARGQDKRELTYIELLKGGANNIIIENSPAELSAEFHFRLIQSLSIPLLAILAIPLGLLGQGRTGTAFGIGIGVVCLVLYEKTLGFVHAYASAAQHPIGIVLWICWLALCIITIISMAAQTGAMQNLMRRFKGLS